GGSFEGGSAAGGSAARGWVTAGGGPAGIGVGCGCTGVRRSAGAVAAKAGFVIETCAPVTVRAAGRGAARALPALALLTANAPPNATATATAANATR
ncbi:MAG TPA: hypothetical protein VKG38_06700, partial [Solirubrobacteraceae bacterium]|nr:hypothetical protein [Solirubrobacteraceae bacterium]